LYKAGTAVVGGFLLEEEPYRREWEFPNVKMGNQCLENYFFTAGNWEGRPVVCRRFMPKEI